MVAKIRKGNNMRTIQFLMFSTVLLVGCNKDTFYCNKAARFNPERECLSNNNSVCDKDGCFEKPAAWCYTRSRMCNLDPADGCTPGDKWSSDKIWTECFPTHSECQSASSSVGKGRNGEPPIKTLCNVYSPSEIPNYKLIP